MDNHYDEYAFLEGNDEYCRHCGQRVEKKEDQSVSPKSRAAAAILCFFLGFLGIHRFYVGKIGTGILMIICFFGFFGIWVVIDLIFILIGRFRDSKGRLLIN